MVVLLNHKFQICLTNPKLKNKMKKFQFTGSSANNFADPLFNILPANLPQSPSTETALELLENELLSGSILSFNAELDKVLKDEITPKRITELAGFPGSGKTQICFQLCVTTQLPKALGGLEGQVIYISTNKNFASHRLRELNKKLTKQICKTEALKLEAFKDEYILKNIFIFHNNNIEEIFATVKYLSDFLKGKKVKLVIIDSISCPLKDVEPKERTSLTYKLLDDFQSLATVFNFALVMTNDITTRIKDGKAYHTPSFGDSFFDRVNSRICLSRSALPNIYIAELVKSVVKAPLKTQFFMF